MARRHSSGGRFASGKRYAHPRRSITTGRFLAPLSKAQRRHRKHAVHARPLGATARRLATRNVGRFLF